MIKVPVIKGSYKGVFLIIGWLLELLFPIKIIALYCSIYVLNYVTMLTLYFIMIQNTVKNSISNLKFE